MGRFGKVPLQNDEPEQEETPAVRGTSRMGELVTRGMAEVLAGYTRFEPRGICMDRRYDKKGSSKAPKLLEDVVRKQKTSDAADSIIVALESEEHVVYKLTPLGEVALRAYLLLIDAKYLLHLAKTQAKGKPDIGNGFRATQIRLMAAGVVELLEGLGVAVNVRYRRGKNPCKD